MKALILSLIFLFHANSLFADSLTDVSTWVEKYDNLRTSWVEIKKSRGGSLFLPEGKDVVAEAKLNIALIFLYEDQNGYLNEVCLSYDENNNIFPSFNDSMTCSNKTKKIRISGIHIKPNKQKFGKEFESWINDHKSHTLSILEIYNENEFGTDMLLYHQTVIESLVVLQEAQTLQKFAYNAMDVIPNQRP